MIYVFLFTLFLPIYTTEAGGEFGSCGFVVSYTGTTETVTRTVFGAETIYVIMWTGHGYFPFLHDLRAKLQKKIQMCKIIVKNKVQRKKMPNDSWSKRRIFCGIKSRAKEERNALTEVARTEQREPASDVGTNDKERTAEPCPN